MYLGQSICFAGQCSIQTNARRGSLLDSESKLQSSRFTAEVQTRETIRMYAFCTKKQILSQWGVNTQKRDEHDRRGVQTGFRGTLSPHKSSDC